MLGAKLISPIQLVVENLLLPIVTKEITIPLFTERFPCDVEYVNPVRKGGPCGVAALYSTGRGIELHLQ
jgi:hypothetical protein